MRYILCDYQPLAISPEPSIEGKGIVECLRQDVQVASGEFNFA